MESVSKLRGYHVLPSKEDSSINFVKDLQSGDNKLHWEYSKEKLECRYVQRVPEYMTLYLSSHSGCRKGCKFCWLTQSGQTYMRDVSVAQYLEQAEVVFSYLQRYKIPIPVMVHYAYMSRGEFFSNSTLFSGGQCGELFFELNKMARKYGCLAKHNISTIMPREVKCERLYDILDSSCPTIYYSLYSLDKDFRKRWVPNAMDPLMALDMLKRYQEDSKKLVKLHWAFIEGENDSEEGIQRICEEVRKRELGVEFNLVRFNAHERLNDYREPPQDRLDHLLKVIREGLACEAKEITRVGYDVKASCGMFV